MLFYKKKGMGLQVKQESPQQCISSDFTTDYHEGLGWLLENDKISTKSHQITIMQTRYFSVLLCD